MLNFNQQKSRFFYYVMLSSVIVANSSIFADIPEINLPTLSIQQTSNPTPHVGFSEKLDKSQQPSLFAIIMAEFAVERGNVPQALAIYKNQSFLENTAPVFERALSLSLQHESPDLSLQFADAWQRQNPSHIPALFYATHLALKAHEYEIAGEKLNQILQYDPSADLSQILLGIYPTEQQDQASLLETLQSLDIKDNPSLLVLKAGLLLQANQPDNALVQIDKALQKQPESVAFITLKADILQAQNQPEQVIRLIDNARQRLPHNKSLFLYQTRYLLKHNQNLQAWELLNAQKNQIFLADDEIKLLASLVGIDVESYKVADKLLLQLVNSPHYKDQAYYYLGISAERQLRPNDAILYYDKVMQPELVMQARKRQIAILTKLHRYDDIMNSLQQLREQFDDFVPQSYIMQASLLQQLNQTDKAMTLLDTAQKQLPNNTDIMFARVLLLPDSDTDNKKRLLKNLTQLVPDNVEYQLEYAQLLVKTKSNPTDVTALMMPLINDKEVGLKARQILAQQSIHQQNSEYAIFLLSDNFDIIPDVISGLLLRQAYINIGNSQEAERIQQILTHELQYQP